MSNFHINKIARYVPGYKGTYPKDSLPTVLNKNSSVIVNMDNFGNNGTHWVAIYNDAKHPFVEYFDSFGQVPPTEVEKYLSLSGKDIIFNTKQVQPIGTNICGQLCIKYILLRAHGFSPYDIIYKQMNAN